MTGIRISVCKSLGRLINAVWGYFAMRKEGLSIMLPLLMMHCMQTGLLLLGNLTGRVHVLPFEHNTVLLCSHSSFRPVLNLPPRLSLTGDIVQELIVV